MAGASDQTIFDMIRKSAGYRAIDRRDQIKVEAALNNKQSNRPSSWLGQAAWELARRDTVGPPAPAPPPKPPDPPPTYKQVAPRTAYAEGGSDARYCVENQPGVVRDGDGWRDEVARYDQNGLCVDGRRSNGSPADCYTGARGMDGRAPCELPTQGDPTRNTGSWLI